MNRILILVACSLFFQGCAISRHYIDPSYQRNFNTKNTLAIVQMTPISTEKFMGNLSWEAGSSTTNEHRSLFLKPVLTTNLKAKIRFYEVSYVDSGIAIETTFQKKPFVNNKSTTVMVPEAKEPLMLDNKQPDYILFLYNISVGTVGGGTSKVLTYETRYAAWDNKNLTVFAYGRANSCADGSYGEITKTTWLTAATLLSDDLAKVFFLSKK